MSTNPIPPTSVAPTDLDKLLSVDEFLRWVSKEPNAKTRRWAMENARRFEQSKGREGIPALKLGREWFFHPRTVLSFRAT
jgi:hypothetical protein